MSLGCRLAWVAGAFAGTGCSSDDPPLPPGRPILPAHCRVLTDQPLAEVFERYLLSTDLGIFVAWLEFGDELDVVNPGLVVVPIATDGTPGPILRSSLVEMPASQAGIPRLVAPVGDRILVRAGTFSGLFSLESPNIGVAVVAMDPMIAVEGVALDSTRLGLFSSEPVGNLAYRVLDAQTATVGPPTLYDEQASSIAAPGTVGQIARTVRLVGLADGNLFAAWVSQSGTTIRGMIIDADGVVIHPAADLATADLDKPLFVPRALELEDARLALAWTGQSGTEVRSKVIPADLQAVTPGDGIIVNLGTAGSQEFANLVDVDGEVAVTWATIDGPLFARRLTASGGDLAPTGDDLDPVAGCSLVLRGEPAVVTAPNGSFALWQEGGWKGPDRILIQPIAP